MTAAPGTAPAPADGDRTAVAMRLAPAMLRIGRRIRPSSGDLAVGHFSTLATLYRYGAQRPSDLARIERFSPPAVTRIVGALEERGLVERRPSPDDARSTLVAAQLGQLTSLVDLYRALGGGWTDHTIVPNGPV